MIPLGQAYRRFCAAARRPDYQPAPADCANTRGTPGPCAGAYQAARKAAASPPDHCLIESDCRLAPRNPNAPPWTDGYQTAPDYSKLPARILASGRMSFRNFQTDHAPAQLVKPKQTVS